MRGSRVERVSCCVWRKASARRVISEKEVHGRECGVNGKEFETWRPMVSANECRLFGRKSILETSFSEKREVICFAIRGKKKRKKQLMDGTTSRVCSSCFVLSCLLPKHSFGTTAATPCAHSGTLLLLSIVYLFVSLSCSFGVPGSAFLFLFLSVACWCYCGRPHFVLFYASAEFVEDFSLTNLDCDGVTVSALFCGRQLSNSRHVHGAHSWQGSLLGHVWFLFLIWVNSPPGRIDC